MRDWPSRAWLRIWGQPGRWARLLLVGASLLVAVMFARNEDNAGQPHALRGGGEYLPILDRGDGHMLFLMARSTALDLDWDFNNDLGAFGDPWGQPRNKAGKKQIPHPIGPPLVWTPVMWIAHAGAAVANVFGANIPKHGYTEWHQRIVFFTSVLAALLAVWLGRRLAKQLLGTVWAPAYAAIAVLLGTSITYYATYMPSYGHALDAGACGAFLGVWALTIGKWEWRRWIVLGLLLGIAMLIRTQDIALGIVVALEVAAVIVKDLRARAIDWRTRAVMWIAGGTVVLGVALVVFTPQLYYWHRIYGDWFSLPQGPRYTRLGSPMILELLYAPRNGWFSTHPIAYLSVIGLFCVPKRARFVAFGLGVALAIQVYLNSTIIDWWAMASWGQRRLCSVTLVLVVGLAALLWRCGQLVSRWPRIPRAVWHALALVVLVPMMLWNLYRISDLKGGKAAPDLLEPTCCKKLPERWKKPITWVYSYIGNPFQFPANAWFAIKHRVEIQRWDQIVGYYALIPPAHTLLDDRMYDERGAWRIGYPLAEPYLGGLWSGPKSGGPKGGEKWFRWTMSKSVRAIVPNLMPYPQRMKIWLAPGFAKSAIVRWDDDVVARPELQPGWNAIVFDRYDMPVGEHELSIEADVGQLTAVDEGWPLPTKPVGVAVNLLEVEFIRPSH